MKHTKKLLVFVMAFLLCIALATTAFALETNTGQRAALSEERIADLKFDIATSLVDTFDDIDFYKVIDSIVITFFDTPIFVTDEIMASIDAGVLNIICHFLGCDYVGVPGSALAGPIQGSNASYCYWGFIWASYQCTRCSRTVTVIIGTWGAPHVWVIHPELLLQYCSRCLLGVGSWR